MGRYEFTRAYAATSAVLCVVVWSVTAVAWWIVGSAPLEPALGATIAVPLCTLWCFVLDTLLGD